MNRSTEERLSETRRLLVASRGVYEKRDSLADEISRSTGLSLAGVELGFSYLERDATDAELVRLVEAVTQAAHVHVILSANVFIAPLRALALARAAAPRVTLRPSPRDPVLAQALV